MRRSLNRRIAFASVVDLFFQLPWSRKQVVLTEVASQAGLAFISQTCPRDIPLSIACYQNTGLVGLR
jgi:hypothetical protein